MRPRYSGESGAMRPDKLFPRTSEERATYRHWLRVMFACYGALALTGFATFALKPSSTSANVTIEMPAAAVPAAELPAVNLSSPY